MDIEKVRLGMPLITSGGIQGKVVAISKEGGLWLETADRMRFPVHVECVRSVDELRPNDIVRAIGRSHTFKENVDGKVGKIDFLAVYSGVKCANVIWADGESSNVVPVAQLVKCDWTPIAESDGKPSVWTVAPVIRIGDKVCLHGKAKTVSRCYNGQPDMLSLAEVAKCYKQVEPAQLFMSREARRVIEYLKARDCPVSIHHMFESMKDVMSGAAIMDGLIEAREAGIVRLDDGKYSIVRD